MIISQMFLDYFREKIGILGELIEYLLKYVERICDKMLAKEGNSSCAFVFAGNVGEIQNVETIIRTAQK